MARTAPLSLSLQRDDKCTRADGIGFPAAETLPCDASIYTRAVHMCVYTSRRAIIVARIPDKTLFARAGKSERVSNCREHVFIFQRGFCARTYVLERVDCLCLRLLYAPARVDVHVCVCVCVCVSAGEDRDADVRGMSLSITKFRDAVILLFLRRIVNDELTGGPRARAHTHTHTHRL